MNITLLEGLRRGRLWHWLIYWGATGTFFTLLRYLAFEDNHDDNDGDFYKDKNPYLPSLIALHLIKMVWSSSPRHKLLLTFCPDFLTRQWWCFWPGHLESRHHQQHGGCGQHRRAKQVKSNLFNSRWCYTTTKRQNIVPGDDSPINLDRKNQPFRGLGALTWLRTSSEAFQL